MSSCARPEEWRQSSQDKLCRSYSQPLFLKHVKKKVLVNKAVEEIKNPEPGHFWNGPVAGQRMVRSSLGQSGSTAVVCPESERLLP